MSESVPLISSSKTGPAECQDYARLSGDAGRSGLREWVEGRRLRERQGRWDLDARSLGSVKVFRAAVRWRASLESVPVASLLLSYNQGGMEVESGSGERYGYGKLGYGMWYVM